VGRGAKRKRPSVCRVGKEKRRPLEREKEANTSGTKVPEYSKFSRKKERHDGPYAEDDDEEKRTFKRNRREDNQPACIKRDKGA